MARILDVIECTDMGAKEMVHRIPERGQGDFRLGSQLIVRFRDGKAMDTFGPGRHMISTANLPLLDRLVRGIFSGKTIFTAECYFVSTRDMIDQRWGTSEPIALRDAVLRMVRIRAHGTYNMVCAARSSIALPISWENRQSRFLICPRCSKRSRRWHASSCRMTLLRWV